MNGPEHPHVDALADHHEGLLAGDEQAAVQRHVAGCADCQRFVAQLDEVSRLLSAEGQRPVTMPTSVATRLEGALAGEAAQRSGRVAGDGAHRSAAVTSLASRRTPGERSGSRRVWPVLAAAAAVVVVSAVGIQVMQGGGGADNAARGGGSAEDAVQEGGAAAAPEKGDTPTEGNVKSEIPSFRGTSPASVAALSALARDLADGNPQPALSVVGVCVTTTTNDFGAATRPVSLIQWRGKPAILEVDVARHRLVVLDCKLPGRRLFTTTY